MRGPAAHLSLAAAAAIAIACFPLTDAALLLVLCVAAVVALLRPKVGVLLIVVAIPFGSLRQVNLGAMNVGATEGLVILVIVSWLTRMFARREVRVSWPPLALPLVIFLAVLGLSILGSTSLSHSLKEMIKWLEFLALYVYVTNEFDDRWLKSMVLVVLATGLLVALHGIYQFWFRVGPEEFMLFGRFMRAHGTFEQPNPYAGYLGLTLPVGFGLLLAGLVPKGQRVKGWWLACAATSSLLMLAAIIMAWSRGAWLGLAGAAVGMLFAAGARNRRTVVLGALLAAFVGLVVLAGGLSVLPSALVQRFSDFLPYVGVGDVRGLDVTDANFAVLERMAHWQAALDMWTDSPWVGVGIGNYEPVYSAYALPQWPLALGHAHNYYLNIGAESGVTGLLAYLLVWCTALRLCWKATRNSSGWHWGVVLGILGAFAHLTIHSFFDNLFVHGMYLQVAMLLAIAAARSNWRECASHVQQRWG